MIIKVRTHPIDVFYCTGQDAANAREFGSGPCFTTSDFGADGFAWETAEEFESDYAESFGDSEPEFASHVSHATGND